MNKILRERLERAVAEELENPTNQGLLQQLREATQDKTLYWDLSPEDRNALNKFFTETSDVFLKEVMYGVFPPGIVMNSMFILCFEVGYRMGLGSKLEKAPS